MSESSVRGKSFEQKVASLLRSKLKIAVQRDRRSGAGWNKSDISDYWNELPLHLEIKDQENIKIKEFFRQADAGASFGKAPTVVFAMDEEILTCLRFTDLLNFLIEITDLRAENDDLRKPLPVVQSFTPELPTKATLKGFGEKLDGLEVDIEPIVEQKKAEGKKSCRAGHLADDFGYCMQLSCKFSRGYKPPKVKRGAK